jgi:hypothetical protein
MARSVVVLISCKQTSSQSVLADELLDALDEFVLLDVDDALLAALDEELLLGSPCCVMLKLPGAAVSVTPSEKFTGVSVVL